MRDSRVYTNPDQFDPDRFEEVVGPEVAKLRDPLNYAFGFGRRYALASPMMKLRVVFYSLTSCLR